MLNLKESDECKIFVTSDWHYNHKRDFIWKSRGFSSIEEHNEAIINNTNECVRENDILFNLGDLILTSTIEQFESLISRIKCKNMYLLFGNHPNRHFKEIYKPMVKKLLEENYTEESEIYPLRYKNIIYIGHYAEVILGGQYCVLSHFPIYVWNEMAHHSWQLTGHSHNGCPLTKSDNLYGKILDVGWDGHGKPWSIEEIRTVMDGKRFVAVDHHHPSKISA